MLSIPPRAFYVYILSRPDGSPFYVGKGSRYRIYAHDYEAKRGHDCHKCRVIRKIWRQGKEYGRTIVFTSEDEQEAFAYERELIALYGRATLTNSTDGGEGMSGCPVNLGRVQPPEERAMRSIAQQGRVQSDEAREKIRQATLGNKRAQGAVRSAETREKLRITSHERAVSEETRRRMSEAQKGKKQSPATQAKRSASLKASWARRKQLQDDKSDLSKISADIRDLTASEPS
jgi:hypothetical protein